MMWCRGAIGNRGCKHDDKAVNNGRRLPTRIVCKTLKIQVAKIIAILLYYFTYTHAFVLT